MSSSSVGRGFVFVVIILFMFPYLLTIIPADFIGMVDPTQQEYYDSVPTGTWVGDEIAGWNEQFVDFGNLTINKDWVYNDLKVGDHDLKVRWVNWDSQGSPIYFYHSIQWTIFYVDHLWDPPYLNKTQWIENLEDFASPQVSRYVFTCSEKEHALTWYVSLTYNATKFSSLDEAYDGTGSYPAELRVFIGLGWNSTVGSVNAWYVISNILTFQTPNVHPLLNGVIGFSLWACMIYLAYILITRVIPLIGGG